MTAKAYAPPRVVKWMRSRGWHHRTPDNGLRRRLYCLASERYPWYDWGHRLKILVGRDGCGIWDEPKPPTWWYRLGEPTRMARTGYPRHPLSTFEIVTDYDEFRRRTEGLNDDELGEWKAIYVDQDGELQLGCCYWGRPFYGLTRWEVPLLRRYLRAWRRRDWYGLRTWLYLQGLHACVYQRKPFACNAAPPPGQGGYDHWLCQLRRGHDGLHRRHAHTWGEIGGEPIGVVHDPTEARR